MSFVRCEECGKVCRGGTRCPAYEESQAFYKAAQERAARNEPKPEEQA